MSNAPEALGTRPQFVTAAKAGDAVGVAQKPLTTWERIYEIAAFRKGIILVVLALAWELYARHLDNQLLVPTFSDTVAALVTGITSGGLTQKCLFTLQILLTGYASGIALAAVLTVLGITTRIGRDFLEMVTSMFNPLPAIALLPLAMLWFGLGHGALIFVLVHSVIWAVALNTYAGFVGVSETLRMVGRNYGLNGLQYVAKILIPAGFPSILTGLKTGWAFAWRTLIAAELVFGVSNGSGGLGWFIYESKNQLEIPSVFAGLLTIIVIGLFVENVIFRFIESCTVKKWGMQH
jgi:NitT/TauT family transport system permease protein